MYEELTESIFIHGTESMYPSYPQQRLTRQNGIAYDESNPKADNFSYHESDDLHRSQYRRNSAETNPGPVHVHSNLQSRARLLGVSGTC